ncbi:MAG: 16S rRNA (cytosine(1402)-N(4))-methyltransferase RsmH [Gammaproteobacteria bacterium]
MNHHSPVLLAECLEALAIKADGVYADATFGRGGHSLAMLEHIGSEGRLIAIDRDATAIEYGKTHFAEQHQQLQLIKSEFAQLGDVIAQYAPSGLADGVLLDLGVSSPQLDNAERGFSFRNDGPLDMRMDASAGQSAAQWLAKADVQEIRNVIKTYGEERFAHRIAAAIVKLRQEKPLTRTRELAACVESVVPRRKEQRIHPATKTFQGIRIYINDELGQLRKVLDDMLVRLAVGGRLAVISFHSLEDRIVKRFMRDQARSDIMYSGLDYVPDEAKARLKLVGKQIRATDEEIEVNPRSRSAVLRVAERLA